MDSAAPLFAGWKETMVWTCLQGHMGSVATDGRTPPESAPVSYTHLDGVAAVIGLLEHFSGGN